MEQVLSLIELMTSWAASLPNWLMAATSVVAAASGITALTPSTADNRFFDAVLRLLNVLAGNVGANENANWKSREVKRRERARAARDRDQGELGLRPLAMVAALGLLLAGCAQLGGAYDFANNATREGIATAIVLQCVGKPIITRQHDLADINARVARRGSRAKMLALDCNADGEPDF